MIHGVLLAAALLAANPTFELQTIEGQSAIGEIAEFSAGSIMLAGEDKRNRFPLESLATLVRQGPDVPSSRRPTMWVEFVDQTGLTAFDFTSQGAKARVEGTRAGDLDVPTDAIRWVRFSPPAERDERLNRLWNEIVEGKAAGDVLVIRKNDALDFMEGIVSEVDLETCKFQMDKQPAIAVKRTKIEGIIFYHKKSTDRAEPLGIATADDGSKIAIRSFELAGDAAKITMAAGPMVTWPLGQLKRIDFSSGKTTYLSDLDPESAEYVPFFEFGADLPSIKEYYHFRRDSGFDQSALRLDGRAYRKGLALPSRTTLAYRLPEKFRVLKAVVGIDDAVRATGHVKVEIKGDGKVLWQAEIRGEDAARELEVDISGVKKLELLVDFAGGQDIGDRLVLADARILK